MALILTLNDTPLLLPDDSERVLDAIDYLQETSVFDYPTHPTKTFDPVSYSPDYPAAKELKAPNWPSPPNLKINQLYWPVVGASRYAYGYFLIAKSDFDSLTSSGSIGAFDFKMESNGTTITEKMFALSPRPLFDDDSTENVYILPLVDERFFWQTTPFDHDNFDSIVNWIQLVEAIKSYIENFYPLEYSGSDFFNMLGPDTVQLVNWYTIGILIDSIASSVGMRYVRVPGRHQLVSPSKTDAETRWDAFRETGRYSGGGKCETATPSEIKFRYWDAQTPVVKSITNEAITGRSGWTVAINSSLNMGEASIANAFVDRFAGRFFAWRAIQYDYTLADLYEFANPDGYEDAIIYDLGSRIQGEYQLKTRIAGMPSWVINHNNFAQGESIEGSSSESGSSSDCPFESLSLWICCDLNESPEPMNYDAINNRFVGDCNEMAVTVDQFAVTVGASTYTDFAWQDWCDVFCLSVGGVFIGSTPDICGCVDSQNCITLGIDFNSVRKSATPDFVLGLENGCLVLVELDSCRPNTSGSDDDDPDASIEV